jgi:hypothetical protein
MLKKQGAIFQYLVCFFVTLFLFSSMSCGVRKAAMPGEDEPLAATSRKLILHNFAVDQNLASVRPDAAVLCENAALQKLLEIGPVPIIAKSSSKLLKETDTIIVKARLTSVPGATDQVRGKTQTGRAKMTAHVRLIDASTGRMVGEKNIVLSENLSAASAATAAELGKLIARYVGQVVRDH